VPLVRALKGRLGNDASPEGLWVERPSGRVPWPSRRFSARIKPALNILTES